MKRTPAQAKAQAKYEKNTIDHIYLRVPKGFRDKVAAAAEKEGLSMNAYVLQILSDAIDGSSLDNKV